MVFKFLQVFPLSLKSFCFQLVYAFFLMALVLFLDGSWQSFFFGFLFSQAYILLFFYSIHLVFHKKRQKLGVFFLFLKWPLLVCVLYFASLFLEMKTFLIGLSAFFSFLFFYILDNKKRIEE